MLTLARRYGQALAERMFRDFRDRPEWRGPKFTWSSFPGMVQRLAKVSVFTIYRRKRMPADAPQQAAEFAAARARRLAATLPKKGGPDAPAAQP
jgi:hypothetical protein